MNLKMIVTGLYISKLIVFALVVFQLSVAVVAPVLVVVVSHEIDVAPVALATAFQEKVLAVVTVSQGLCVFLAVFQGTDGAETYESRMIAEDHNTVPVTPAHQMTASVPHADQ